MQSTFRGHGQRWQPLAKESHEFTGIGPRRRQITEVRQVQPGHGPKSLQAGERLAASTAIALHQPGTACLLHGQQGETPPDRALQSGPLLGGSQGGDEQDHEEALVSQLHQLGSEHRVRLKHIQQGAAQAGSITDQELALAQVCPPGVRPVCRGRTPRLSQAQVKSPGATERDNWRGNGRAETQQAAHSARVKSHANLLRYAGYAEEAFQFAQGQSGNR